MGIGTSVEVVMFTMDIVMLEGKGVEEVVVWVVRDDDDADDPAFRLPFEALELVADMDPWAETNHGRLERTKRASQMRSRTFSLRLNTLAMIIIAIVSGRRLDGSGNCSMTRNPLVG